MLISPVLHSICTTHNRTTTQGHLQSGRIFLLSDVLHQLQQLYQFTPACNRTILLQLATALFYSSLQPHYFTPACNRTILLQLATALYCTCHSSQKPNTSIQACTYLCIGIKTQTCEFLQRDLHPVQCLTAMHTDDTDLPMHRQLVCRHAQSSCYFTRAVI